MTHYYLNPSRDRLYVSDYPMPEVVDGVEYPFYRGIEAEDNLWREAEQIIIDSAFDSSNPNKGINILKSKFKIQKRWNH